MPPAGDTHGLPARLGIVGLGLIGGSIAARVKAAWPDTACVGVDSSPAVRAAALDAGLVDDVRPAVEDLADCGLVVLATPVPDIIALLSRLGDALDASVVTDVGSTKRRIVEAARGVPHFVGGHPVAGAERGGLDQARPGLFEDRPWALTPDVDADPDLVERVERFVTGLGAMPVRLTPEAHDRAMAYLSHVPQLVAVALMNAAASRGVADAGVAGQGFRDMTRLAASPGDLWQGILGSNHDFVQDALRDLRRHLPSPGDEPDASWVRREFAKANQARGAVGRTGRT